MPPTFFSVTRREGKTISEKEKKCQANMSDYYGKITKQLGNDLGEPNIGSGVLDWSYVSSDGIDTSFDDRYDFFQFKP